MQVLIEEQELHDLLATMYDWKKNLNQLRMVDASINFLAATKKVLKWINTGARADGRNTRPSE